MLKTLFVLLLITLSSSAKEDKPSCDYLGTLFYEDIGCKPVYRNVSQCPVEFDCNLTYKKDRCLLKDKQFEKGEEVAANITNPSCHVHCYCEEEGKFSCGELDCLDSFEDPEPGCYYKYEINTCCSYGTVCPTNETKKTCKVDGNEYRLGEEFIPEDFCTKCVCDENFNGTFDGPNCRKLICNSQLHYGQQIKDYCAPFYKLKNQKHAHNRECCPDEMVCGSETDEIVTISPKPSTSDTSCRFGTKLLSIGEGVKKKFYFYGQWIYATCECVLPPFLTCTG